MNTANNIQQWSERKSGRAPAGDVRRPDWTRRNFFQLLGAGVRGIVFREGSRRRRRGTCIVAERDARKNTAKNVIFVLMAGAPSPWDTFDFKRQRRARLRPSNPQTVNGITWPTGIMPKLGDHAGRYRDCAVACRRTRWCIRWGRPGCRSEEIQRRRWGISRRTSAASWRFEKAGERKPSDVLPTFLALNSDGGGRLRISGRELTRRSNTIRRRRDFRIRRNTFGQTRWQEMLNTLYTEDAPLRANSPLGKAADDMDNFYSRRRA